MAHTRILLDEIDMKIDDATKSRVVYSEDEKISILNPLLDGPTRHKVKRYHKLTKEYIKFLSEIQEAFFNTDVNPLIQNDIVTQKGAEYLGRMKLYEKEIRKLYKKESANSKIGIILNTESIQNRDASETPHIVYYFDGIPKTGIMTYLRQKQHEILLLEKDFLNDLMLENLNKELQAKN